MELLLLVLLSLIIAAPCPLEFQDMKINILFQIQTMFILSFLLCLLSSCGSTEISNTPSTNSTAISNSEDSNIEAGSEDSDTEAGIETQQVYYNDQTYTLKIPSPEYVQEFGYPVNESGETYGPVVDNIAEPDLTLAINPDGVPGYVRISDLDEDLPSTPEEAANYNSEQKDHLNLYLEDGHTVIGIFPLG